MSRPDRRFFEIFSKIKNVTFLETGTYKGGGIEEAISCGFDRIISIEAVKSLYQECSNRFKEEITNGKVLLLHGDSKDKLPEAIRDITTPIVFWLDAHYQGIDADYSVKNCPLDDEITYICEIREKNDLDVILIDDVRLLTKKTSWKGHDVVFEKIIGKLLLAYPNHTMFFINGFAKNDVLTLVPNRLALNVISIHNSINDTIVTKEGDFSEIGIRKNTNFSQKVPSQKNKYVLLKGKYGMGGRLMVLIGAMHFAKLSGRELIVDWNDGYYDDKTNQIDVYSHYIKQPYSNAKEFYDKNKNSKFSIYPEAWTRLNFEIGETYFEDSILYRMSLPYSDVDADVVVAAGLSKITMPEIKSLLTEIKVHERIENKVKEYFISNFKKSPIGVHVRHGNGENGVLSPKCDWFVEKIAELRYDDYRPVFLATDSPFVLSYFKDRVKDLYYVEKEYPETGSLHKNISKISDPFQNGDDALVDMLLLSKCNILLVTGHYFSQMSISLGGGSSICLQYPEKNRLGSGVPGFSLSTNMNIHNAIKSTGARVDNLRYLEVENYIEIYYGYDKIHIIQDINDIDKELLKQDLIARRLYF
jgi:Nodulation protein Z (NodZ)